MMRALPGWLLALLLLVLLLPLLLLLALLIRLDDGGPVLHNQKRVGKGGRLFRCFKFRSMAVDAEAQLESWRLLRPQLYDAYMSGHFKLRDDPRVTRMGRLLRASSLDELPQLANVVLGQMALVGPRPILPRESADYGPGLALYQQVLPGMTGLWQVRGRSNAGFRRRARYDRWYIRHRSWALDLYILAETIPVVLGRRGAY